MNDKLKMLTPRKPIILHRDVSLYLLDRLLTVHGLQWGRVLLQPLPSSAHALLIFAARVLDEAMPASSEEEALLVLSQCPWHEAAKHTAGEEDACLSSLSTLVARALTLGWRRVYCALAHFVSMLAREPGFYPALPFLVAMLCVDRQSRTLASPVLPLFAFHECSSPSSLVLCFARLYALPLSPEEEVIDDSDPAVLIRNLGQVSSGRRRDARAALAEELAIAEGGLLGQVYRTTSTEAASLHQSAVKQTDTSQVRSHVPRLPLLHALYRVAKAAVGRAEKGDATSEAFALIARLVVEELAVLSALALRPPERTQQMQAEAALYAGSVGVAHWICSFLSLNVSIPYRGTLRHLSTDLCLGCDRRDRQVSARIRVGARAALWAICLVWMDAGLCLVELARLFVGSPHATAPP